MVKSQVITGKTKDSQLLEDLFRAYYAARKNKRNTKGALEFEVEFEKNIFALRDEIRDRTFTPSKLTAFIVNKPVKREIFASQFKDRVVHHLLFNYLNPIFDPLMINDSYSCREEKGTSYGIKRVAYFTRACSNNFKEDSYILKLDIQGYFMTINKERLFKIISKTLIRLEDKLVVDLDLVIFLLKKIIFKDPVLGCIVKSKREAWQDLPKHKSLFFAGKNKGLPIGNLTSQLFANIYLNEFDQFVKRTVKIRYYGRYVDDMVFVSKDKVRLKAFIAQARWFLWHDLGLKLHPKKIYFQAVKKGVSFLGVVIRPYRILMGKRIKGNFYKKIYCYKMYLSLEKILKRDSPSQNKLIIKLVSAFNSYLGMMVHYHSYKLRKKLTDLICLIYKGVLTKDKEYKKIIILKRKIKKLYEPTLIIHLSTSQKVKKLGLTGDIWQSA